MKKSTIWKITAFPMKLYAPTMYRARLMKYLREEAKAQTIESIREAGIDCSDFEPLPSEYEK